MKLLISLSILIAFYATSVSLVLAQSAMSDCVTTRVGAPGSSPPQNPENCTNADTGNTPGGVEAPPPPSNIRQGIYTEFGITMDGFDQQYLVWAWEKLWDVSNTKFKELTKGATIAKSSGAYSQQVGCRGVVSVKLRQSATEEGYKFVLTHELGHFIRNCTDRATIKYDEHINAYTEEGAISFYGRYANTCNDGNVHSEDYADMIAYYLNPEAGISSISTCAGNPLLIPDKNPLNPFFELSPVKQVHLDVVRQIL